MEIKDILKRELANRHMSQQEFATRCGLTPCTISRYMSGTRTPNTNVLRQMAAVLGVSVAFFFENKPESVGYMKILDIIHKYKFTSEELELIFKELGVYNRAALLSLIATIIDDYMEEH